MPHQSLQRVVKRPRDRNRRQDDPTSGAMRCAKFLISSKIMKREHWLYLVAAGCGAAIWILIALASGRNEAWDSGLYFSVGIPAVCLVSMAFAFFEPNRSWRWGVLPMVGQFVWMLISLGPGNLLPLGVIVFGVLSVPPIIAARIGAFIATKIS